MLTQVGLGIQNLMKIAAVILEHTLTMKQRKDWCPFLKLIPSEFLAMDSSYIRPCPETHDRTPYPCHLQSKCHHLAYPDPLGAEVINE